MPSGVTRRRIRQKTPPEQVSDQTPPERVSSDMMDVALVNIQAVETSLATVDELETLEEEELRGEVKEAEEAEMTAQEVEQGIAR